MRFPFFATNKALDTLEKFTSMMRNGLWNANTSLDKRLLKEIELRQKLESRIAALEVWKNHGRKKRK